ncbi:MAG: cupin [Anaerocolumna sp.]
MKPDIYDNNKEGILCVYKNEKWLVSIKNWKPDNDIAGIAHLEIHHTTDEQFILAAGKAILITAERENDKFKIELTLMMQGKVYNVPKEVWFYSITQKNTKMMYVQDSNCSMENSDFMDLSPEEIAYIQDTARKLFAG